MWALAVGTGAQTAESRREQHHSQHFSTTQTSMMLHHTVPSVRAGNTRTGDIANIEEVQRTFVRKICFSTPHNLNYWERLSVLGLYSLERRRERYRILYAWKVLENLVPNISSDSTPGIQSRWNLRTGRTCVYPRTVMVKSRLQSIHEGSFVVHGSKLFNCLPRTIRNLSGCSINVFKNKLDKFLREVPDEPVLPGYTGGNQSLYGSNSLLQILPNIQTHT